MHMEGLFPKISHHGELQNLQFMFYLQEENAYL